MQTESTDPQEPRNNVVPIRPATETTGASDDTTASIDETPHTPTDAEAADIGRPGITFDQLVAIGREQNPGRVEMPWSFTYEGHPVTHENDNCYLVGGQDQVRFERGYRLLIVNGVLAVEKDADAPAAAAESASPISDPEPWICENCGTTNDPAPPDAIVEKCGKCSEPSAKQKARIDGMLGNLSGGVGTAKDVEETARQMEGVAPIKQPLAPPKDRMLPYRGTSQAGRFDADDALEALKEARGRVVYCEEDHEADVKRAKASGQRLKDAQEEFNQLFDSIYERKVKADDQPDMFAEAERRDALARSGCPVERSTGAPCPACQSQRAKGKDADPSEPLHPAHPQHEEVAKALLIKDLNDLQARLEKKNFFIEAAALQLVPVADLQVLQRYSVQTGIVPPELILKAHTAAAPGTDRQECKRCGAVLIDRKDIDNGVTFYPDNVSVGLDCEGPAADQAPKPTVGEQLAKTDVAAAADEAPPKPKSHAKKDGKKKSEPERERQAQAAEGRKKTAKPAKSKKAGKN